MMPYLNPASSREVIDQMDRTVRVPSQPRRIVSLVPSQTELLFDLGLGEEVVGLTKFCIHPAGKKKEKTIVGGPKNFHFDTIAGLEPDLILGNKEENYEAGITKLAGQYPVWMSDIQNLADALEMIRQVGAVTARLTEAENLIRKIRQEFASLRPQRLIPTAYLIWRNPYMSVGADTFIHGMLQACGLQNVFSQEVRYPEITLETLAKTAPQVILLSSEPYPFQLKHLGEFQTACPGAVVRLVDGEMFSWYGSRLQHAPAFFQNLRAELQEEIVD